MGGLPRRDLWLLPLIALLTVIVLFVCAEGAARIGWPEQTVDTCQVTHPAGGLRYRPDCVSRMKAVEGAWYTNRYNACGYRSDAPCGPVPPGTRRIVLLGSSVSQGYLVGYDDTIGYRVEAALSAACHFPVEVQNLGAPGGFGPVLIDRMDEALRLRPDQLLLVLLPFDLEGLADTGPTRPAAAPSGLHRVFEGLKLSRALIVAQHFLFRDPSIYLPLYLRYGDKADFLRPPFSAAWGARLAALDHLLADLADRAARAGVPFLVTFVPQEAEVALMAGRVVPPGIDPAALPAAIGDIARRHKIAYLDASARLRLLAAPERLYYQVDGHLAGRGQRLTGQAIADAMAAQPGPFAACRAAPNAS